MEQISTETAISGSLAPGNIVGSSPWLTVDQDMISRFGDATLDPDPMHIDPEWSKQHSPYGGTIAFGFLTSSLLTHMLHGTLGTSTSWDSDEDGYFMNYGMDYLRYISPVLVNSRVRGHFKIQENRVDRKGRNIVKFACEVEIEAEERPALVAEWLAILIPHEKE